MNKCVLVFIFKNNNFLDILIRNAFFDEQDAVKITSTINELLNKCLILSQRATITTERLGRALQLLQKCDNELDYLEQLISKVELSETTDESKDKSRGAHYTLPYS